MPCRLATAATGSRSASRMIATICSSENRPFRIAPSESGASLSTYRWSENPRAGHGDKIRKKAAAIRKRFIHHHPTYGGIILKSSRVVLEAEIGELEKLIETHKQTVLNRFANDARKSIEELVKAFWRE